MFLLDDCTFDQVNNFIPLARKQIVFLKNCRFENFDPESACDELDIVPIYGFFNDQKVRIASKVLGMEEKYLSSLAERDIAQGGMEVMLQMTGELHELHILGNDDYGFLENFSAPNKPREPIVGK